MRFRESVGTLTLFCLIVVGACKSAKNDPAPSDSDDRSEESSNEAANGGNDEAGMTMHSTTLERAHDASSDTADGGAPGEESVEKDAEVTHGSDPRRPTHSERDASDVTSPGIDASAEVPAPETAETSDAGSDTTQPAAPSTGIATVEITTVSCDEFTIEAYVCGNEAVDGVHHVDGVCDQPQIVEFTQVTAQQNLLQAACGYSTNPVLSAACSIPLTSCGNYCLLGEAAIRSVGSGIENTRCVNSKLERAIAEHRCDGTRDTAVALLSELGAQCREELQQ